MKGKFLSGPETLEKMGSLDAFGRLSAVHVATLEDVDPLRALRSSRGITAHRSCEANTSEQKRACQRGSSCASMQTLSESNNEVLNVQERLTETTLIAVLICTSASLSL